MRLDEDEFFEKGEDHWAMKVDCLVYCVNKSYEELWNFRVIIWCNYGVNGWCFSELPSSHE